MPVPVLVRTVVTPPLDDAQLETPPVRMASTAISSSALRRRARAEGSNTSPQASGRTGQAGGREERAVAWVSPVAISTVTLPVMLAGMPSLAGLKAQVAEVGSVPHWKVKTPCEPLSGLISRVK